MGAGAYVCGEETALISSCEGLRGDPKTRPPFPAQKGYLDHPTVVNNVETLCCVAKIMEEGAATFSHLGTVQSSGTKLLSVSGDCERPGIYEVELGLTVTELLQKAGAPDAIAVQVGGAAGQMISPDAFDRSICFDDLATGGSIMIFGPGRNILDVAHAFLEFFEEESCGYCTPCRVGNVLLRTYLERILAGRGEPADLEAMERIARTMVAASRCGLGQTSSRPVTTTLQNFRPVYEALIAEDADGFRRAFDLKKAVAKSEQLTGRASIHTT
jgi:[NiFe] hydrogenase diaphorase moiety large subunit